LGPGIHNLQKNSAEIEKILKKADLDGNGSLSYEELMLSYVHRKLTTKEERLFNAFSKLDLDGDGRVTSEEMEKVLSHNNVLGTQSDIKKMLAEVDKNGDGTIDYEEFLQMMWAEQPTDKDDDEKKPKIIGDSKDIHPTAKGSKTAKVATQENTSGKNATPPSTSTDKPVEKPPQAI